MSRAGVGPGSRGEASARARWALLVAAVMVVGIGLVLLFLLAQATNNRELYERNYLRLFVLNIVVAGFLAAFVLWAALRLWRRLRQGKFGSRLLVKLATIFALVGFFPGMLIYVVSYQFVSRSIESWFDIKVEGALEAGLNLGRATLDALSQDLASKTRAAAAQLAPLSDTAAALALERLREQLEVSDVVLWSASGQLIASSGQSRYELRPERPTTQQLRLARSQRVVTQVEGFDEATAAQASPAQARIRALAVVVPQSFGLTAEPRYLQVTQVLPPSLVANALAVQEAYREYQERALGREGLRRMYIGTLTLTLFLALFGAVLLAVLLGNQLVRPLIFLADGMRRVAAGDLTPITAMPGKDELGGLTRSFATMTEQLAEARTAAETHLGALEAARASLQTILDNLTAGVIVLDRQGRVRSSNPGADRILRLDVSAHRGSALAEIPGLEALGRWVAAQFDAFEGERETHGLDHWQQTYELHTTGHGQDEQSVTLVVRGALLPDGNRLLVFDDISEIVSAQRARAWGEVARRLAHEIKNPLTPIQLSAERLERKLAEKLDPADRAVLVKSVKTIVDQVDAMKRLVNEFRDYARLPTADLKPLDLNALVHEVLQMYENDPSQPHRRISVRLDPQCPPIVGDAQQLRQVLHNLIQNAQDACDAARQSGGEPGGIEIRTQWIAAAGRVRLTVADTGCGFSESTLKRAFEPYVTTKPKGTGLGLAVVKKIADEHRARVDISNRSSDGRVEGAQVSLSFPLDAGGKG